MIRLSKSYTHRPLLNAIVKKSQSNKTFKAVPTTHNTSTLTTAVKPTATKTVNSIFQLR
jgi:hypothetical protein